MLYCYFWENCNRLFDNFISESKYNMVYVFNIILYLLKTLESIKKNDYIWYEIYLIKKLKANMLVGKDITNKSIKKKVKLFDFFVKNSWKIFYIIKRQFSKQLLILFSFTWAYLI